MQSVILFDGVCNLCNGFVQFVIERDKKGVYHFASLQSETARELLGNYAKDYCNQLDTVVLLEGDAVYTHSDVALRVAGQIGGAWKILLLGYLLPKRFRDAIYGFVARNRYRWFGRKDQCMVPTPDIVSRFL